MDDLGVPSFMETPTWRYTYKANDEDMTKTTLETAAQNLGSHSHRPRGMIKMIQRQSSPICWASQYGGCPFRHDGVPPVIIHF